MKYVPADKLITEIERLKQLNTVRDDEDYAQYELDVACGYDMACEEIVSAINSFRQEPRFPQYDNIVDKVFGAGNMESWEYREAEMLVTLAKEELLKSLQQEQPEADWEKEYTEFVVSDPVYSKLVNGIVGKSIARHFYELGLNARKEGSK